MDSGELRERPLLDINARDTMGRLSLGLQKHLHDGEEGYFIAQRKDSSVFHDTKDLRSFSLSPPSLNGKPNEHRFVVVCGKSISDIVL